MKRVAVFGGAGFLGTNLVHRLIDDKRQVYNFDNLSGLGNLLNLADLMQKPHHVFARCDVSVSDEVRQALLTAAADTIFVSIAPRNKSLEASLEGLRTFLESLVHWRNRFVRNPDNVQKIIVLLTKNCDADFSEQAIQLIKEYADKGLPIVSLSVPLSFGPFQQPDTLTPYLIYRALEGESIPVISLGNKTTLLTPVKDVIDALLFMEENGQPGEQYRLIPYSEQLTNLEIAETICEVLNEEVPPPMGKYQALIEPIEIEDDSENVIEDYELDLIPFKLPSSHSIKESIAETVKWYLSHPDWYRQSKTKYFDLWQNPKNVYKLSGVEQPEK